MIQAGLTDGAGNLSEELYPDLDKQWPRLLYHRHFMLAEFLNEIYQPPGPPPELADANAEAAAVWRGRRARYEHVRRSMTMHLQHAHPGSTAAIRRIEHLIPDVIEFQQQPIELSDQRLYQVLLDQPPAADSDAEMVAPTLPPEAVPPPAGKQSGEQPDTDPRGAEPQDSKPLESTDRSTEQVET